MVATARVATNAAGDFNGAMAVRPWMAAGPPAVRRAPPHFNGAMAVRPWMGAGAGKFGPRLNTSMGPWP